jgi:pectate lyase
VRRHDDGLSLAFPYAEMRAERSLQRVAALVIAAILGAAKLVVVATAILVLTGFPAGGADAAVSSITGFAASVTGGTGRPTFLVSSLADHGTGTLRDALARAAAEGGGTISFAVSGDIVLASGLMVPPNTTLDGADAPTPGITLWGDAVGGGGGVVDIERSNIIVRGLRIRDSGNDGIHIAPHTGDIAGIVVDHCSVTNSADGGIDVTGRYGFIVSDVTLSWNYIAGSGAPCAKGTCGGGSLIKYGVTRISVHANFWDKNLRRNPAIDGGAIINGTLADVRGNVVTAYAESGVQILNGARANVVGNFLDGVKPAWFPWSYVYAADNVMLGGPSGTQAVPWPVPAPVGAVTRDVVAAYAGAQPRDELDRFYIEVVKTYAEFKSTRLGSGSAPSE